MEWGDKICLRAKDGNPLKSGVLHDATSNGWMDGGQEKSAKGKNEQRYLEIEMSKGFPTAARPSTQFLWVRVGIFAGSTS